MVVRFSCRYYRSTSLRRDGGELGGASGGFGDVSEPRDPASNLNRGGGEDRLERWLRESRTTCPACSTGTNSS